MRTFGPSLAAIAIGVALVSPPMASAQRNNRRSSHSTAAPRATSAPANPCSADCGDYSLAIVSALLPAESSGSESAQVVTLVIENRGTAPAPVSFISVAPKNQLAAARHSTIPALAPGERATVQLPVENGPDGTQCISITISPAPARDPATVQALASATPNRNSAVTTPPAETGFSRLPELPYWPDLPTVFMAPDDGHYAASNDAANFDAIRKSETFGALDA